MLEVAWENPFALSSNFARSYTKMVALAASLGWLSSIRPDGHDYDTSWHLTAAGLTALEAHHQPPTEV